MLRHAARYLRRFAGVNALLLAAVTIALWQLADKGAELIQLIYITVLANVYICMIPHEPLLLYYGKTCGYWSASIAAGYGAFAAGVIDYETLRPFFTRERVRKLYAGRKLYQVGVRWFNKKPFMVIFLAALTPAPMYPFKFLAISSGYSKYRYLLSFTLGRSPRYLLYTWVADRWDIPNWVIAALVLVTAAAAGWGILRAQFSRAKKTTPPAPDTTQPAPASPNAPAPDAATPPQNTPDPSSTTSAPQDTTPDPSQTSAPD